MKRAERGHVENTIAPTITGATKQLALEDTREPSKCHPPAAPLGAGALLAQTPCDPGIPDRLEHQRFAQQCALRYALVG